MLTVVTGASGFVGRALCELLASRGESVRAVVRSPERAPKADEVLRVDDLARAPMREIAVGAEVVVHLANIAHVRGVAAEEYRRVNVEATIALARAAAEAGVRRLVYVSSIKVNGEETGAQPFRESDTPSPRDAYGLSKWEAENALETIHRETGLGVTIIRPPLVYGPGVRANFLMMLRAVDRGIPLPLASVRNARSLIFVRNLADALAGAAAATKPFARYLVSDGEDVSTPELLRRVGSALGRRARLLPFPQALLKLVPGGAMRRLTGSLAVDSSAIRRELGWTPPWSLDDGLAETASWYRSRGRAT